MLEAQQAVDLLLLHQILSSRYSAGVVQRIQAQLNRADADLFARLQVAIEDTPGNISAQAEYLTSMLASVRTMNAAAYSQVQVALKTEMRALAAVEVQFNARIYGAMAGSVPLAAVGADSAYAAAMSRPFQGRLLREIVPEMGEARMRRIRDSVRTGFVTGKTSADIVRELRGTKKAGFVDAFLEVDRRHLETVVHSALGHTAATAREQFMEANKDVIASVVWLATLDSKTSAPCRLRDQRRYTADTHKPIGHSLPWGAGPGRYHFRCRSVSMGLLKGQEGLYGQRASIDGPVDAGLSYNDWLKRQTDHTQDEVLGVTRARLFRDGGLTLDKFSTARGEFISLKELRKKGEDAFKRAGL